LALSDAIPMKNYLALALTLLATACGGGGGGGGGGNDSNYAGNIVIDLERDHIDSGDLTRVALEVVDINPKGAIMKIRLSKSLRFVANSAVMFPDRKEERPTAPDKRADTDNERFLVFFIDPRDALGGDFMSLAFNLKGTSGDKHGFIEVDLDNNDPNIPDSKEFDAAAPRFTAKERRSVHIEGDSIEPTPTATPVGTVTPG
jgi:hypothetical protein